MALTRAQLLMGNNADGVIIGGQPQGVRPGGAGITIAGDGTISVNASTIVGVMKLNTPGAYNNYFWPAGDGTAGQQLQTDGAGNLSWADADGIPWTAKGQLVVGTGLGSGSQTILNVGTNTSLLVADSSTASGLNYTSNTTTAMLAPVGTGIQRPISPVAGQIRFNSDTKKFEMYTGLGWEEIASGNPVPGGNTFVKESIPVSPLETGNALIPAGSTVQRQTAPAPVNGATRFNTDTGTLEVFGGGLWKKIPSASGTDFVQQTIPLAGKTPSAIIPPGATGQEETVGVQGGWMRYNTTANLLEFYNGTTWELVAPSGGGVSSFVQSATPTALNTGDIWYDTVLQRESVWNGGAWVQPGVTQTGPTGAANIPAGLTGQQPAPGPNTGSIRYNTSINQLEYSDSTVYQPLAKRPATLLEAATGTDFTVYSSPATAVPKTTADMTGFIILTQSAAAPATQAYFHYNTTSNHLEYHNGTTSKTALEREGDNMTGKLSVTPQTIGASWNLSLSNYWDLGAVNVPLPTNLTAGQGGLILITAAPLSWPAPGGILKYAGGTIPNITAGNFPAIMPYYTDGANVYLGAPTTKIQ